MSKALSNFIEEYLLDLIVYAKNEILTNQIIDKIGDGETRYLISMDFFVKDIPEDRKYILPDSTEYVMLSDELMEMAKDDKKILKINI